MACIYKAPFLVIFDRSKRFTLHHAIFLIVHSYHCVSDCRPAQHQRVLHDRIVMQSCDALLNAAVREDKPFTHAFLGSFIEKPHISKSDRRWAAWFCSHKAKMLSLSLDSIVKLSLSSLQKQLNQAWVILCTMFSSFYIESVLQYNLWGALYIHSFVFRASKTDKQFCP